MLLLFLRPPGEVEETDMHEKDCLKVFRAITVIKEQGMVLLEVRTACLVSWVTKI